MLIENTFYVSRTLIFYNHIRILDYWDINTSRFSFFTLFSKDFACLIKQNYRHIFL
ncbi:hypothetical protein HanXRQr2_Chr06g0249241 [Helianthus annuus]|uniref:Uncharacterized protein n=1 Tax=Helianthus annuus TaxID=4232 RepID=A0A9K3IRR2_HELAN|nr:hypothetical protein HanXRQr2_Chr06g0249241 [Helianthus annuus]